MSSFNLENIFELRGTCITIQFVISRLYNSVFNGFFYLQENKYLVKLAEISVNLSPSIKLKKDDFNKIGGTMFYKRNVTI